MEDSEMHYNFEGTLAKFVSPEMTEGFYERVELEATKAFGKIKDKTPQDKHEQVRMDLFGKAFLHELRPATQYLTSRRPIDRAIDYVGSGAATVLIGAGAVWLASKISSSAAQTESTEATTTNQETAPTSPFATDSEFTASPRPSTRKGMSAVS